MSNTFRFVPPPSATNRLLGRPPAPTTIDTQVDKAVPGSRFEKNTFNMYIKRLSRQREELLEESVEIKNVNKTLFDLLQKFGASNRDIETAFSTEIYDTIMKSEELPANLRESVQRIFETQKLLEPLLPGGGAAPSSFYDPSDSEQSRLSSAEPGTAKQNKTKAPASGTPKRLFPDEPSPRPSTGAVQPESSQQPPPQPGPPPSQPTTVQPDSSSPSKPSGLLSWFSRDDGPKTAVPTPPSLPTTNPVRTLAKAINRVLQRALTPLLDSIGALAFAIGEQDVRSLLVYDERNKGARRDLPADRLRIIDEEDPQLTTVAYLMERYEPILGNAFLNVYLEQTLIGLDKKAKELYDSEKKKETTINDCVDFDRDLPFYPLSPNPETLALLKSLPEPHSEIVKNRIAELETAQEAARMIGLTDAESRFAPAWAFSMLGNSVFRAIASPPVLAAFEMATNQVRSFPGCSTFTLKELLCSPATMNHFVFLAARHYMRDISVLAATKEKKGRRAGGNYINVNQARKQLDERAWLTGIWFEGVYAVTNPLLAEFDAYRDKLRRTETLASGERVSMPLPHAQEQRMLQYRAALPQRELRHRE